jgi:hypothetical protein
LRADAREDEIEANTVPCVLDMCMSIPWYNAIFLECESGGTTCEPGRGWFVDLAFEPLEVRAAAQTPAQVPVTAAGAVGAATCMTNNAPVTVVVSLSKNDTSLFPCPYCTAPYAYASQGGLHRHIAKCH